VFYRYTDGTGRVVIVSSKAQIPAALRDQAQRIELDGTPENLVPASVPAAQARLGSFHAPSFLLGLGAALLVGTVLFSFRRGGASMVAKLLGGAALMFVLAGAYFGWLRRTTGQSDSLVSSPTELVDDARRAVEKVERRREEQEQVLEEIESEAKR
jgi:hypothetical protein